MPGVFGEVDEVVVIHAVAACGQPGELVLAERGAAAFLDGSIDDGTAADLLVKPLERVVAPDLASVLLGEAGEGEQVRGRLLEQRRRVGEALLELVDDAAVLLEDRVRVGLGEDRPHHRRDEALRALGHAG